jgi:hypothetical protein
MVNFLGASERQQFVIHGPLGQAGVNTVVLGRHCGLYFAHIETGNAHPFTRGTP